MHPIKNLCVSAAVLAVGSQYPGAAEVKRPCTHSQVTLDAAVDIPTTLTSSFLKQVKQILLKCVCLESHEGIQSQNNLLHSLKTAAVTLALKA